MPEDSPPLEYQIFDPDRQEIRVVLVQPPKQRVWLHILLFVLTLLSTLAIGAHLQDDFNNRIWPFSHDESWLYWSWAFTDWHRLLLGIPFATCLLGILFAHEMGHYVLCRRRGVLATLPFFIPFPSLIGTLGAVIRIRSPIRSRKDLFDIGIAGPIAGFVVAVPVLFFSLMGAVPMPPNVKPESSFPVLGMPLIFGVARWILSALNVHVAAAYLSASQVLFPPTAIAAWFGMFATALNLIPGGQLDGGHIVFALNPRWHRLVTMVCVVVLLALGWYCSILWLLWAVFLRITASRHPLVPPTPGLGRKSRVLAVSAVVMLVLTWVPAPFQGSGLRDIIQQYKEQRHSSK